MSRSVNIGVVSGPVDMASYWAMLRSVDLGWTRGKAGDVKVRRHGNILTDRSVSIESYTRRCQG